MKAKKKKENFSSLTILQEIYNDWLICRHCDAFLMSEFKLLALTPIVL